MAETQTVNKKLTELIGESVMNDEDNIYTLSFRYEEHKCIVAEKIPMVSTVADYILHTDESIGYVISIDTNKGSVSIRSRKANSRMLAQRTFDGNGHDRAAGGQLDILKTDDLTAVLDSLGFKK